MLSPHKGNLQDKRLWEDSDPEEEELQTPTPVFSSGQHRDTGSAPQQGLQQQASFPIPAIGVTDGAPAVIQPTSQDIIGRDERDGIRQGFPPGPSLIQRPTRKSSRWAQKATFITYLIPKLSTMANSSFCGMESAALLWWSELVLRFSSLEEVKFPF